MNREIKFRGFREYDKKWIYGSLVTGLFGNIETGVSSCNILDTDEHPEFDCFQDLDDMDTDVIPESVGEFTVLTDKNGKEIYEGDIIQHNENKFVCGYSKIFGFVWVAINKNLGNFHKDGVLMKNHNYRSQSGIYNVHKYITIIGNIYENHELLK